MAKIHQLNIRFDALEDRLVLSICADDGTEVCVLLTRRYTKLLLAVLEKFFDDREEKSTAQSSRATKDAVKAFKREEVLSKADFSTHYQQTKKNRVLGEKPLLVSKLTYKLLESGLALVTLGMPDGQNINLNLNQELVLSLIKLLENGASNAEWMLSKASPTKIQTTQQPSNTLIH